MTDAPADPFVAPVIALDLGPLAVPVRRSLNGDHPGETGTMLPPLVDHHVHLMLVGADALADTAIAGILDLGAPLDLVAARVHRDGLPRADFAGAFLTAPGGYPIGRPWAAPGCAREVEPVRGDGRSALPSAAETAVSEQQAFGASVIKVALNADVGPVFDASTLDAIVRAAHERGMPVVAHVEGDGMTRLAVEAGVDALAHTPFTEHVDDALVARAVAIGQRWISTLFVTGYGTVTPESERAADNLRRFLDAGGRVLYGTDLGNGDQPLGVNPDELSLLVGAGLDAPALLAAIADPWPRPARAEGIATFVPGPVPDILDDVPAWLATACVVPTEDLEAL
ncbi:amidohydrolase family protein [Agromyces sp. NPDC004153]